MMVDELGEFDSVLDVGGNVGEFAELCKLTWPAAAITSFEPVPRLARENDRRAQGRWMVQRVAAGADNGRATIRHCLNQHSASTLLPSGPVRREMFGIRDEWEELPVQVRRLDDYIGWVKGRCLLKVDVEGFELEVLAGAQQVLELVDVVLLEVNQAPVFIGQPTFRELDDELEAHGLRFEQVLGVQMGAGVHALAIVQFDGAWTRR